MEMAEKTVPWWRRALEFAVGGIRSGFGLFQRGAKPGDLEEGATERGAVARETQKAKGPEGAETSEAAQQNAMERLPQSESRGEVEDLAAEIPLPAAVVRMKEEEAASNLSKSEPVGLKKIEPEDEEIETTETETAEIDAAEIEQAAIEPLRIEHAGSEMSGEAAARQDEVEVPEEPMTEEASESETKGSGTVESELITEGAVGVETIEESSDEEWRGELETVEAEATVVETGANAQAEELAEDVKAVKAPAEEPAGSEQSSEPGVDRVEEPALEEEIEMKAAEAEEAVIAQTVEVEITKLPDESSDQPGVIEAAVVLEAASEEAVRRQAAESDEAPVAEGKAEEILAAEQAEVNAANVDEIDTPAVAEAEAKAGPEIVTEADAEAEVTALQEADATDGPEPESDAVAEPVAVPAQMELIPKPLLDEKAAARLAEQQRRRKEAEEESPFSVMVGQVYEGPLDLLLDLIRKQDIDIYDIPIAKITAQFLAYVNQLKASDVDVAGEFIYTASLLIHIKSKMLLPRTAEGPGETPEDPRRELVERLLEHERFKNAAQMLQQKQMMEAASWSNPGNSEFKDDEGAEPEIAADTVDLVRVFREILERARNRPVLDVAEDTVTVGQMIRFLGRRLMMEDKPIALRKLLSHTRSERALIAMFLALLELVRLQAVLLRQDRQFSEIFIKKHASFESVMDEGLANARDDWR